jgi:hypothetical protein
MVAAIPTDGAVSPTVTFLRLAWLGQGGPGLRPRGFSTQPGRLSVGLCSRHG